MADEASNQKSLAGFAVLMALCAASHVSVHLPQTELSAGWMLGVAVFLGAMWLLYRPTVSGFLGLAALQIVGAVVDAPYNPDHWLLVFFVNALALEAAWRLWRQDGTVSPQRLVQSFAPGARVVFLICYGFAALSKYNSDFLFNEKSVARELLGHQVGVMPVLSWLVWPPVVPWIALACETAVLLLLLSGRTRRWGILVGLLFHAALIISPAVAVFDFTLTVYLMLYLFTPAGFEQNVRAWIDDTRQRVPEFFRLLRRYRLSLSLLPTLALITVSLEHSMGDLSARLVWLRWMVAMTIVCGIILLGCVGLFAGARVGFFASTKGDASFPWRLEGGLPYAILGLAIINGLCPYIGLKTQGSFTMFSNLRTEADKWNHLLVPESVRIVNHYQDRLVHITDTDDPVLKQKYVERGLLATEFEVRRRITSEPSISLTVQRDQKNVVIDPTSDPVFGDPVNLLSRKLLIFRPVSPDDQPFLSN